MNKLTKKQSILNILMYFIGTMFLLPMLLVFIEVLLGFDLSSTILNFIIMLISALILIFISKDFLKSEFEVFKQQHLPTWSKVGKNFFRMILCNIVINLIIFYFMGESESANQTEIIKMSADNFIVLFLFAVVSGPIVEELVFRASIFSLCKSKKVALVLSTCLFGLLHVFSSILLGNWSDLIYFLTYACMGYWITRCYYESENFFGALVLHTLNNLIGTVAMLTIIIVR